MVEIFNESKFSNIGELIVNTISGRVVLVLLLLGVTVLAFIQLMIWWKVKQAKSINKDLSKEDKEKIAIPFELVQISTVGVVVATLAIGSMCIGWEGSVRGFNENRLKIETDYGVLFHDSVRENSRRIIPAANGYLTVNQVLVIDSAEILDEVIIMRDNDNMITLFIPAEGDPTQLIELPLVD